jgi:hypothetical protein
MRLIFASIASFALVHPVFASSKYEIIFSSAFMNSGRTNFAAYILDRQANKGNYCTATYTAIPRQTLTAGCIRIANYSSHLSAGANIQSKAPPPVETTGYAPAGVWQIDQDTGAMEFCLLEPDRTTLPNGNCIDVTLR